jgi:galactokinase
LVITWEKLLEGLASGALDRQLEEVYTADGLEAARGRALTVAKGYREAFSCGEDALVCLVSGPGRTELGGNHTDHQRGRVLCGSLDLDALACAGANGQDCIRVLSEGYPVVTVDLARLQPVPGEENTSAALIRGVAAGVAQAGYPVAGFDAYVTSSVMVGSGLSSSAAFEILLGNILNHLCCGDSLDAMTLAQIGQRAENVYFGKPCGLLDQAACSVGGAVAIDFADPAAPAVERLDFDFGSSGYHLCIVDTGSCHADLTDDYAAIPGEMKSVAACFGKEVLREVDEGAFYASLSSLRGKVGDRAVLRAIHFFQEDRRVTLQADALRRGDMEGFLKLVDQSGQSSFCNLQNVWSGSDSREQAVMLALARGRELLGGRGAIRVHGGGFAGTIQAFVPEEKLEEFRIGMEALLGPGMCHCLRIRPQGGCIVVS